MESERNTFRKKHCDFSETKISNKSSEGRVDPSLPTKKLLLEILRNNPKALDEENSKSEPKVLISIRPQSPDLETLYSGKKTHRKREKFQKKPKIDSVGKTHSLFRFNTSNIPTKTKESKSYKFQTDEIIATSSKLQDALAFKDCQVPKKHYDNREKVKQKCNPLRQNRINTHTPITEASLLKSSLFKHVQIGDIFYTNTLLAKSENSQTTLSKICKKIHHLERKILKQEMVYGSMNSKDSVSSSDEEINTNDKNISTSFDNPGCSCIEYSHVPETNAFQKYTQQTPSSSSNKPVILEKKHNSEQYSRDFTTYDGITARGRRQCASMTYKRDSRPKEAADRIQKIRHRLPPVRDYRLMDTVHYLAQGEFAPRDDGIKLTSSREAVLSDIIWEDVCRTHWPNARIGRRGADRSNTRYELQRLIDSLLRERVAHIERRRRRHYRIIKLNNRHENAPGRHPTGKTGDIIVASQKERDSPIHQNDTDAGPKNRHEEQSRRVCRSCERLSPGQRHRSHTDDCSPGPSCAASPTDKNTWCFLQPPDNPPVLHRSQGHRILEPAISICSSKTSKNPKLVIKKDSRRKYHSKEGPDLEHFILLPALVIRTSSSVRKQKKFSTLYQRVSNKAHRKGASKDPKCVKKTDDVEQVSRPCAGSRSIGFSINLSCSSTSQNLDVNNLRNAK